MGRSPCCEKVGLKKGPWTPEEDHKLLAYIEEHGHGSWRALPAKAGLQRCGKSCRLRWTNYLRPDIKRGKFSLQEEQTIIQLHALLGNRWSAIATHMPMRTDNEIKNYWNTHLKKRLAKMGIDPVTHKPKNNALSLANGQSKNDTNLSHMAQWESARLEAEARLVRESKLRSSSFQPHLGTMGSDSGSGLGSDKQVNKTNASTMQPPSFDVLKAWQGILSKSTKCDVSGADDNDLESPTSTLSLCENSIQLPGIGFGENPTHSIQFMGNSSTCEDGLVKEECVTFSRDHHDMIFSMEEDPWTSESQKTRPKFMPMTNFLDGFNDLILENLNDPDSSFDRGNSDNADRTDSDDYGNKNYWNSVLNLVNSSPSDSPVF